MLISMNRDVIHEKVYVSTDSSSDLSRSSLKLIMTSFPSLTIGFGACSGQRSAMLISMNRDVNPRKGVRLNRFIERFIEVVPEANNDFFHFLGTHCVSPI